LLAWLAVATGEGEKRGTEGGLLAFKSFRSSVYIRLEEA